MPAVVQILFEGVALDRVDVGDFLDLDIIHSDKDLQAAVMTLSSTNMSDCFEDDGCDGDCADESSGEASLDCDVEALLNTDLSTFFEDDGHDGDEDDGIPLQMRVHQFT